MDLVAHYRMFGHYNVWANARLYDAAARLGNDQYLADRGAFFKSVHGTLNHLLATDRIWMRRFTGEGDAPDRLDAILFETFDGLRAAREAEDRRITSCGRSRNRLAHDQIPAGVSSRNSFRAATGRKLWHWFQPPDHVVNSTLPDSPVRRRT